MLEWLLEANPSRDAVVVLLAYCKATARDYQASNRLLCQQLSEQHRTKADQLQAALVYLTLGMWKDAAEEFFMLVRACPHLPVICLLLGDVLAYQGQRTKALLCWRLAVKRDRDDGLVAVVARQMLSAHLGGASSQGRDAFD